MPQVYSVGIVGLGDIALRRHIPVIARSDRFHLAATASQRGIGVDGVRGFRDYREMLELPDLDVVAICTPPAARFDIAANALRAGKHVLLEKPTTATLGEADALRGLAALAGRVAYASWHSQQNHAVAAAAELVGKAGMRSLNIRWHEDFLTHHAGQQWIWEAGGFGVFDAGINALSIATAIAPRPLLVTGATLGIPRGAQTPATVRMELALNGGEAMTADFDWLKPTSDKLISLVTEDGRHVELRDMGSTLVVDAEVTVSGERREYDKIYETFADLLDAGRSEINVEPLRLVADAWLVGDRQMLPPIAAR